MCGGVPGASIFGGTRRLFPLANPPVRWCTVPVFPDKLGLKLALRRLPIYAAVRQRWEEKQTARWHAQGCPLPPPPSRKRQVLREHARTYGATILVETGTYLGDTIGSLRSDFAKLYSIEFDDRLFRAASRRFNGDVKTRLLHGDSGQRIHDVLAELDRPAVFWLDGHYSGTGTGFAGANTPIFAELEAIAVHRIKDHVMVIDDARLFGQDPGYPSIPDLERFVAAKFPAHRFEVREDLIRIVPATGGGKGATSPA